MTGLNTITLSYTFYPVRRAGTESRWQRASRTNAKGSL